MHLRSNSFWRLCTDIHREGCKKPRYPNLNFQVILSMPLVNCKIWMVLDTYWEDATECLVINCTSCWGHLLLPTMLMNYAWYGYQLQWWEGCYELQPQGNTGCTNEACVSFSSQKENHDTQHCSPGEKTTSLCSSSTPDGEKKATTKVTVLSVRHPWKFCWALRFLVYGFTLSSKSTLRGPEIHPNSPLQVLFHICTTQFSIQWWKRK